MACEDEQATLSIQIEPAEKMRAFLGRQDRTLRILRDTFRVRLVVRGSSLSIAGDSAAVESAADAARRLMDTVRAGSQVSVTDIEEAIAAVQAVAAGIGESRIDVFTPGRAIRPRTPGQDAYMRAITENDLVFCVGPAGSGKTYLAVAMAVAALKRDAVRKIVLTRPAVEAGERLGFLPGDIQAKVNPYLRPLYDALQDMMALDQLRRYMETDLIEVVPLAYMRGRTLDHAFIILDEGQNCTGKQMKMFLTRLGPASKSVVTGDISQTDLPGDEPSGMVGAMGILHRIRGIGFVRLTQADIIRHRLVQDIVDAYDGAAQDRAGHARGRAERGGMSEHVVPQAQ